VGAVKRKLLLADSPSRVPHIRSALADVGCHESIGKPAAALYQGMTFSHAKKEAARSAFPESVAPDVPLRAHRRDRPRPHRSIRRSASWRAPTAFPQTAS